MGKSREQQFQAVLEEFGPMLERIAGTYEFDPELRRDLVQDIALALWQGLDAFEKRASLRTYIARIAHNRCVSHVAREAKTPQPSEIDANLPSQRANPEERVSRARERARLTAAVRGLPLSLRQVAALALEGFEPREIAETLGISANNASVRLNRARVAIRKRLSP